MYTDLKEYIKEGLVCAGIHKGDVFVGKYDTSKEPGMVAAFIEFGKAKLESNEKSFNVSSGVNSSVWFDMTHTYELPTILTIRERTLEKIDIATDAFIQGFKLEHLDSNGVSISGSIISSELIEDSSELEELYITEMELIFKGYKGVLRTETKLPFATLQQTINLP